MVLKKPPMGWNSWNTFGFGVVDKNIREAAETLVSTGLKDTGYEYVVIDDYWSQPDRDRNGRIVENFERFPEGIRALSDYVHSLGLKFGMYSCAGVLTCGRYPSSFDNEFRDAETFAGYGVDFLKYDFCHFPSNAIAKDRYNKMSMALKATGRDILFSACNWGEYNVETWIRSTGAGMYRSTGDIGERFTSVRDIAMSQFNLEMYSAPGCYNDMDMLVCGMDGVGLCSHPGLCGDIEYKTHFALWCMMSSPLMIGCDLTKARPESIALLKNPGLLRIDADAECRPPIITDIAGKLCPTMFRHLSDREFALAFFNLGDDRGRPDFRPWDIGLTVNAGFGLRLRDVFTGEVIDYVDDYMAFELEPHDCKVFLGTYVPADEKSAGKM